MQISEEKLFEQVMQSARDSSEAVAISKGTQKAVEEGFKDLKGSFRYDCQSIMNNDIKLALIDALDTYHKDKILPMFDTVLKQIKETDIVAKDAATEIKFAKKQGYIFAGLVSFLGWDKFVGLIKSIIS